MCNGWNLKLVQRGRELKSIVFSHLAQVRMNCFVPCHHSALQSEYTFEKLFQLLGHGPVVRRTAPARRARLAALSHLDTWQQSHPTKLGGPDRPADQLLAHCVICLGEWSKPPSPVKTEQHLHNHLSLVSLGSQFPTFSDHLLLAVASFP